MAVLEELDEEALVNILTEPKNALTKQYVKLFEYDDVELEFREDALREMAKQAMNRKTGARGLRSILEKVLLDTMYELPSQPDVSKVVIDGAVVKGETDPLLIFESHSTKDSKDDDGERCDSDKEEDKQKLKKRACD